jgi:14-3-3 protein epsilon
MVGDYNRYASESCQAVVDSAKRLHQFKQGALKSYGKALDLCSRGPECGITPYNPVKLGLALNFSVFYFEIMGDANKACDIARACLKNALESINECPEDVY